MIIIMLKYIIVIIINNFNLTYNWLMDWKVSWDSTVEIVQLLKKAHPQTDITQLSLSTLFSWVTALPEFEDDPGLANEKILNDILIEWLEENL